jgi:hypothetical protein
LPGKQYRSTARHTPRFDRPQQRACAVALLTLVALSGCGRPSATRYELSGRITYAGQALPAGYIVFSPAETSATGGPAAQAEIHDGHYEVPAARGVVGGPYVATIHGFDGVSSEENGIINALGKPLVSGYRVSIDLPTAGSTQDLDVPQSALTGR